MEKNESNHKDELKPVNSEEDEIDLWELWQTVKKRKYIILITTLIIFAIALLYAFTRKPVYEAKATIQIGKQLIKSNDGTLYEKYFDDAKSLKHMLDVEYDTAGKYRNKNQTSYIASVDIPRKTGGFLTITADAPNNKEAIKTLKKPIDEIMAKHKAYFNSIIDMKKHKIDKLALQLKYLKNNNIPAIKKKIEESENNISKKEKMLANMKNRVSATAKQNPALAAMQMANLQNDIARLSKEIISYQLEIKKLKSITIPDISASIDDLKTSMKPPYTQQTQVVGKIYTHNYPVKPKKKLILVVALVTGLVLGIFLAFFVEFIGSKRREIYEK